MDSRKTRGASGNAPRIAWLPITMNSVSPVTPLDARRMCSRSERFIPAQDAHPLVLRHDDGERIAMAHAESVFAAVGEHFQDAGQTACAYQIEPLLQGIL